MARTVVRGKALVAKLKATPGVRDAEALAATLGRAKKYRKAGMSPKAALKRAAKASKNGKNGKKDEDDPFNEDYGEDKPKTKEEKQQERYEAKLLRDMEKAARSAVRTAVLDAGGLKTRDDLREEYSEIPNTYKRRDGMPGDEMAEYLSMYYPEYGIEDERDLIDFLAS